jgi:hypothetical protein
MARKKRRSGRDAQWAEAKRRCRLNAEEVRMAKELGLNPRKLIKNIPSKSEPWKLPIKQWIHELYARKRPAVSPGLPPAAPPDTALPEQDEEIPF